ncbi:MAG TPA: IPT/TIG domain-containing protein [Jatrophihabitans sp.]|nr:IPT/TIG domain-containing protein [Jatrophihabitans sp.]
MSPTTAGLVGPQPTAARDLATFTFAGQKWWAAGIIALLLAVLVGWRYLVRRRRVGRQFDLLTADERTTKSLRERRALLRQRKQALTATDRQVRAAAITQAVKADRHGGLIMGADRRLSTSKAMATLWTVVVGWMVLAVVLISLTQHSAGSALSTILKDTPDLYLVYLGGPYAAAVFSKISVTTYVDQGRLTKSDGDGSIAPLDLISDDSGNTSLYDFQYVFFNLLVALSVIALFIKSTGSAGLPAVPDFMAILSGGAALTYTVSKAGNFNNAGDESQTAPVISDATPRSLAPAQTLTIFGKNLCPADPTGTADRTPLVQLDQYQLTVETFSDGRVDCQVQPIPDSTWPSGPLDLRVLTWTGQPASTSIQVSVV